ncbi:MAG: fibronectin type III domain-containing protein, partial [Actinomycetota bacterium]
GAGVLTGEARQTDPGLGCYIQWSPNWATDNQGVVGYLIYRKPPDSPDLLLISTVAPSVGWFLDVWYTAGLSYTYTVKAFDAAGNVSGVCNTVSVVGPIDSIKPSVPQNLAVVKTGSTTARLSWSASTDNSYVAYYNIYRTPPGTTYTTAVSSPFDDTGLEAGVTYLYYVTAVDSAANESDKSTSVSVSM